MDLYSLCIFSLVSSAAYFLQQTRIEPEFQIRRIRVFLGVPDPLVTSSDPCLFRIKVMSKLK
jgi:hypothetical protein